MAFSRHSLLLLLAQTATYPLVSGLTVPRGLQPRQASPGFTCHLPDGYEWCNNENNRSCWMRNTATGKEYNIDTDYEDDFPPGIERPYWIEVGQADISPDGVLKKAAQTINGTYPGPLIEACWGDTLVVNVKNTLPSNGTTIHWHGLRMLNQNEQDGVNGVTQCPISEQDTFQYKFQLRQYGHTWYHSHYSAQYTDGVAAPLLIHGPHTDDWQVEWSPLLISDWYHEDAYKLSGQSLSAPPRIDSLVVNGTGKYYPSNTGNYYERSFEPNKKHLIRIINGGTDFHYHFSIDNHVLKVVSADLVPIEPFYTNSLSVGIGQRYSVIVEANQTVSPNGAYWMRAEYNATGSLGCVGNQTNFPDRPLAQDPDRVLQRVGIIRYGTNSTGEPSTTRFTDPIGCTDPDFEPHVPWTVSAPQNNLVTNTYFAGFGEITHGHNRWEVADKPLWLNFSDPTLKNLNNKTWNAEYNIQPYDYNNTEGFAYMIINSGGHAFNGTHPIHLHGHDFAIISRGPGNIDPTSPPAWDMINPMRRDVAMLPNNGHIVLAFKTDNPGAWLLHCHIAWHAGSGLALQVLENQSKINTTIGPHEPMDAGCEKWTDWMADHPDRFNYDMQEDSGI
ncbi:laccase-like multicopper oxidase [Periconia macrospinosa]|uniref:Laccase-like multicopper oxidase n=1 Tax=Periconia macrospinosa TaxID=97972 RepID=A0A2V1DLM8_9PLEO|nr:laccase-like multicopper oxidase [Periconia macrospinosa]